MSKEFDEALRNYGNAVWEHAGWEWRDFEKRVTEDDVIAAESAVRAIHEADRALARRLATALQSETHNMFCQDCKAPEAVDEDCAIECLAKTAATKVALAEARKAGLLEV